MKNIAKNEQRGNDRKQQVQRPVSSNDKRQIEHAVDKVVREYGETLRLLGQE